MTTPIQTSAAQARALLVAVRQGPQTEEEVQELLNELSELVQTAGARVLELLPLRLGKPDPRYFVGSGLAERIVQRARDLGADCIVFDDVLSPTQQRNLERLAGMAVLDRQGVILDIFAQRASTREAELQIELARAEYMLPRLKGAWGHLNRQRGGVGVRGGEGEKQLEVDARLVRRRIAKLKVDLGEVRQRRAEQRKKRSEVPVPSAAIVGYTNAGKSSLLNALTQAGVLVEDKLFATLDPTTRRIVLPNRQPLLLTDTVGFVRKLPHDLVAAFKATLEEAAVADFLILVVDATSPSFEEHIAVTRQVLGEIGAGDKETIIAFNKADLLGEDYEPGRLRRLHRDSVVISARTGMGLDALLARCQEIASINLVDMALRVPVSQYDLVAWVHRVGKVAHQSYDNDAVLMQAVVPRRCQSALAPYLATAPALG